MDREVGAPRVGTTRTPDRTLEELRARLAHIDRSIVLSLCAREDTQREILALKQARSLPLLDAAQERHVRRRARAWAAEVGGDPDLAAMVIAAALDAGKRRFFVADRTGAARSAPVVVFLQLEPAAEPARYRASAPVATGPG
jgi:chorismate mutase